MSLTPIIEFGPSPHTRTLLKSSLSYRQNWERRPCRELQSVLERVIKNEGVDFVWPLLDFICIREILSNEKLLPVIRGILFRQLKAAVKENRHLDVLVILVRQKLIFGSANLASKKLAMSMAFPLFHPLPPTIVQLLFDKVGTMQFCESIVAVIHSMDNLKQLLASHTNSSVYFDPSDVLLHYATHLVEVCGDETKSIALRHRILDFFDQESALFNGWRHAHFISISEMITAMLKPSIANQNETLKIRLLQMFKHFPQIAHIPEIANGRVIHPFPAPLHKLPNINLPLDIKSISVEAKNLLPSQRYLHYCQRASSIKKVVLENNLVRLDKPHILPEQYEANRDLRMTLSRSIVAGDRPMRDLVALLTFEAAMNLPVSMLLTSSSWEAIFQEIKRDMDIVSSLKDATRELGYFDVRAMLIFDPADYALQQIERFRIYGHYGCSHLSS